MSTEPNKNLVRRAMAAFGRGDMEDYLADAADNVTYTLIGTTPFSGTLYGKQAALDMLRNGLRPSLSSPGIVMTIENLIAEGEYVVEQARGQARTATGKDYNNTYCRVWRIVDGKITALVEYLDTELVRSAFTD